MRRGSAPLEACVIAVFGGLVAPDLLSVPRGTTPERPLLVQVVCPGDNTPVTAVMASMPDSDRDDCERRILAHLPDDEIGRVQEEGLTADAVPQDSEAFTPVIKPGWPQAFANFLAQTLATADFGNPRGRATILHERDGTVHALAPDASAVPGWPILLPNPFISTMPSAVDIDESVPDEVLLALGGLHVVRSDGTGLPGWPFVVPNTGFQTISMIAARLRADEPLRIVSGTGGGKIFVLDQQATPLPGWPVEIPKGVFARPILENVAVGDVTGDGTLDIVATIGNESQAYAFDLHGDRLNGFPVYAGGNPSPLLGGADAEEPSLADLDGDGAMEILFWASPAPGGRAGIVALRGDGSFQPGWPQLSQSGTGNFGVAVGDVNGDGDLEVLASTVNGGEPGAGGVYLWHGDGTPVSGWPKFFPNVSFPNPVAIADVDGDGIGDPVVAGFSVVPPTNGLVYAWKGNGQLLPGFPIVIPFRPVALGGPTVDDLEGDGIADLGVSTRQALTILLPGRVHWFDLGVPYRAEGMEWPTRSHDMARTAAYRPPVRRVPMDVQIAPPLINSRTPAPPLTVILRPPPEETARPSLLRLRFVNGQRVEELEGTRLADDDPEAAGILADLDGTDGDAVVFRLDGEAVRALLPGPGEHLLGFWTEAVGGLDGVLYEGEATLMLRELQRRPFPSDLRNRRLRVPLATGAVPVAPAPVSTR